MTDKTIPVPADLARRVMQRADIEDGDALAALLAEHDKATLPDCEVLLHTNSAIYWQRDGKVDVYRSPNKTLISPYVPTEPENFSPLPVHRGQTITPEQHEQVAIAMFRAFWGQGPGDSWPSEAEGIKDIWRRLATAAITALGLVVAS